MKAILIDDEPLALDYLEHQLRDTQDLQIVGKYTDPATGKQAVEQTDAVDVVFLDIHIPEINGLELAEQLLERRPELHVVFVTAYDEYAIQAFELNASDYVLKPVRKERLHKTIERIRSRVDLDAASASNLKEQQIWKLNMFHPFGITDEDGEPISLQWRTSRAEQLFCFLLHHKHQTVGKPEIAELLWPDTDPKKSYPLLYTTIYHIRKTLTRLDNRITIENTSDGYKLTLRHMDSDVDLFETFLRSQPPLTANTVQQYEQIVNAINGEYLQGYDYVWVMNVRHRYQLAWIRTTIQLMQWYYDHKKWEHALRYGER